MAPDFERLARMPWPTASLASSGIRAFSSALDRSCSRNPCRVLRNKPANSAQELDGGHVNDPDRLDPRPRRLDTKEARGLAALDAAPEFLLCGEEQVLIEAISGDRNLDPLAASGDDREHRQLGVGDPHVVLQLGHMFFGRPFFGERPRQHEFGLENRPGGLDHAVEGGRHIADHWVPHPALDVGKDLACIALVPDPIEGLGH